MGARLMAIVAEDDRGRVYLAPTAEHEAAAREAKPEWTPDGDVPARLTGGTCVPYGITKWGDLFTPRQLTALTTFSDLVGEAMARIRADARAAGFGLSLAEGLGPSLAEGLPTTRRCAPAARAQARMRRRWGCIWRLLLMKVADRGSSLGRWDPTPTQSGIINTFSRQALPMTFQFRRARTRCSCIVSFPVNAAGVNWSVEELDGKCLGSA